MTAEPTRSAAAPASDARIEDIERDIEQTRAKLGDTVDELTSRLDPKARAREAADHAKDAARQKAQAAKSAAVGAATRVRSAATDETGRPKPLSAAVVAALAAALLTVVIVRRRR